MTGSRRQSRDGAPTSGATSPPDTEEEDEENHAGALRTPEGGDDNEDTRGRVEEKRVSVDS